MRLTIDALRPRSDAGRGRRSGVKEGRSSAQGQVRGNRLKGNCCCVGDEEDAASAQVIRCESTWEAARREATSLLLSRRPARGEAAERLCVSHAAGMWNRSGRKTHSDRLLRTKRKARSVPRCPAGRSDQLQPQDQCPAREGPTSNFNRRTGVRGVKDQRQTSTAGLGRGRRTNVNSVDSARAACEGPTSNSASTAFPRG